MNSLGQQPSTSPTIIVQTYGAGRRFLSWIGWTGFLVCGLLLFSQTDFSPNYYETNTASERFHSGDLQSKDKIAIIAVDGVIMEGDGFVKQQIDRVRKDDAVKAIVLRVDSPGGTVTGSDYIYHHLKRLKEEKNIPLVVSMGSMATSGGYYVSMAVGEQQKAIFAEPTTTTGSIGVIIPHYDLSGLLTRFDIKDDSIASHPRKQMLSMTRPIPEDHREILQGYVNESFERFKSIVKGGRPAFRDDEAALDRLATGEIFTAPQAKESGLVDEIGFIEEAIQRAAELANVSVDNIRVVQYKRPAPLLDIPLLTQADSQHQLSAILELSTPRAYYLNTTIPPLVASYLLNKPE